MHQISPLRRNPIVSHLLTLSSIEVASPFDTENSVQVSTEFSSVEAIPSPAVSISEVSGVETSPAGETAGHCVASSSRAFNTYVILCYWIIKLFVKFLAIYNIAISESLPIEGKNNANL